MYVIVVDDKTSDDVRPYVLSTGARSVDNVNQLMLVRAEELVEELTEGDESPAYDIVRYVDRLMVVVVSEDPAGKKTMAAILTAYAIDEILP